MLFIGGGLLIHSVVNLSKVDPGYVAEHVLTAQVTLPRARYAGGTAFITFTDEMVARLRRLPAVREAGYARQLPMVRMRQLAVLRMTPEMPAKMPAPPPFDGRQLPESPDTRVVSRDYSITKDTESHCPAAYCMMTRGTQECVGITYLPKHDGLHCIHSPPCGI